MNERDISRLLAAREHGTCEVKTPVGYSDVLTATTVYEVKAVSQWKAAVGQVLAYARYYPQHKAHIITQNFCSDSDGERLAVAGA